MLNVNVNVNVKCKCKCSVYMSDLTTEHYNISIIHSFPSHYKGYLSLRAKAKMSTNSGHRRAVQPTQSRSPSNTDHTTIARQRYLEKNYILGTCDPFTAPADICISVTS